MIIEYIKKKTALIQLTLSYLGEEVFKMQLNVTTDYAIRVILYLSMKGVIVSSKELSEKMTIPEKYILKITKKLSEAGLTKTHIGKNGGFSVIKSAEEINLLDIISTMENTTKINRCLDKDKFCNRHATETCPVRSFYCILQEEIEKKLSLITIQDLISKSKSRKEREL